MRRVLNYGKHRLVVDEGISLSELKKSLTELFPELHDAVLLEDRGGAISVVLKQKMLQNRLDIEFNEKRDAYIEQTVERVERERVATNQIQANRIQASTIHTGYLPGTYHQKEAGSRRVSELSPRELAHLGKMLDNWGRILGTPKQEYPYVIGGQYAHRGSYGHLVGKRAKSVLYDELIGVHLVQPEGEEKEYVIRTSDIKTEE